MLRGPFAVAVAMEKTIDEDTVAKVVVAGSVEMFADSADQIVSGNNSAMFTDIIAQMVGDSDLATSVIPTKDYTAQRHHGGCGGGDSVWAWSDDRASGHYDDSWNCDMGIKKKK